MSDDLDQQIVDMREIIEDIDRVTQEVEAMEAAEANDPYSWVADDDELRRCYIFEQMIRHSDHFLGGFVEALANVEHWLKTGAVKGVLKVMK